MRCDLAYIVQATDAARSVKVGMSGEPLKRFNHIRLSVPFGVRLIAIILDGKKTEREMKGLLSPWQMRGEWFEPRPELNAFIEEKRRQNKIVQAVTVDQDFSDAFIRPAVLAYLGERDPAKNDAGDLVYRFLHQGIDAIRGREAALVPALKSAICPEVLAGFIPLPEGSPSPSIDVLSEAAA